MNAQLERAFGALAGLAIGDALGMPTQSMSPAEIRESYGEIRDFVAGAEEQPIAPGMAAGSVTDDTEQALLLAGLLREGRGSVDLMRLAQALLDWEDDMIRRGSLDLLGPSTKAALEAVRAGADPASTGKSGTTNGAAMRVTPVGIAWDLGEPGFAAAIYQSMQVTHDTWAGWESAALVAAAVSAGVGGAGVGEAIAAAIDFVSGQERRGVWSPGASVLARTRMALEAAKSWGDDEELVAQVRAVVGTSVESSEAIAAAFVIAQRFAERPFAGLCAAANLGGDTDTIGAIAGAILGAGLGAAALGEEHVAFVQEVNGFDLRGVAAELLEIREGVGG